MTEPRGNSLQTEGRERSPEAASWVQPRLDPRSKSPLSVVEVGGYDLARTCLRGCHTEWAGSIRMASCWRSFMFNSVLTQKLLTVLLAAVMACPSWALRDCCCTRGARRAETSTCCQQRKGESTRKVSPCCAARLKAVACAATPSPPSCRPVSRCRCNQVTIVATLTKPVPTVSSCFEDGVVAAKAPVWTVEASRAASVKAHWLICEGSGLDGPAARCVRLCRWLT